MVNIYKFNITKNDIDNMSSDDRYYFIICGHCLNQLGTWLRLLTISTNDAGYDIVHETMRGGQSMLFCRSLYACLHEIKTAFLKEKTRKYLQENLLPETSEEDGDIFDRFIERSAEMEILGKARNFYTSHIPNAIQISAGFDNAPPDDDWGWYLSKLPNNSFWAASETVITSGLAKLSGLDDHSEGHRFMIEGAMRLTEVTQDLLMSILLALREKYSLPEIPEFIVKYDVTLSGSSFALPAMFKPPFGNKTGGGA